MGLVWVPFWHSRQKFYAQMGCAQAATVPWAVGCQNPISWRRGAASLGSGVHSQGSSLSQPSWSQMLVSANPPGCLPPKQAGEQLAGLLQTQPIGKLSQHSCMSEP